MIYAGDMVESMPLNEYYNKMSRYDGDTYVLSPKIKSFYERETEFISKYVDKSSSILDIGCAFGGLLHELQMHGYSKVEGLELSEKNASYAKDHYGINVHIGGIGYGTVLDGKYDLVILSCTLEHIFDICGCVDEIKSFLNDNGKIFFAVPAVEDFTSHEDLYQEFSTEHINYFTFASLINMMKKFGMRLIDKKIDRYDLMGLSGNSFTIWEKGETESQTVDFKGIDDYMAQCSELEKSVRLVFKRRDYPKGFYIWGAGTQTAMLYQLDVFPDSAVREIVDSNKNYTGEIIYGHQIKSPDALKMLPELPVLISSAYAEKAITEVIHKMKLKNEIWTLK